MLEFIMGGSVDLNVPLSGPGPKTLVAGNKRNGWFGVIDTQTMMPLATLINKLGDPGWTRYSNPNNIPFRWLKAMLGGKPVFVANQPVYVPRWIDVYNAGMMLGIDPQPYVPEGYSSAYQSTVIDYTDGDGVTWYFKVRTIRGADDYVTTGNVEDIQQAESTILYNKITGDDLQIDGGRGWDNLKPNVDYAGGLWMTSSLDVLLTRYLCRYPDAAAPALFPTNVTYINNWVPVLEVINPYDELIPTLSVTAQSERVIPVAPSVHSDLALLTTTSLFQLDQDELPPAMQLP